MLALDVTRQLGGRVIDGRRGARAFMMVEWRDMLTLTDLLLMAGHAVVNLYPWVNLICSAKNWQRRRAKLRSREFRFRHHPPALFPLYLLFITLSTGLISA